MGGGDGVIVIDYDVNGRVMLCGGFGFERYWRVCYLERVEVVRFVK